MTEIFPGRWTARLDPSSTPEPDGGETSAAVVLFLIGMRVNKWWRVDQYFWVAIAMARMLRHLARHPELGMVRARNWFGRTTMQVAYWRSLDDLVAFAADDTAPHAPAWRRYYRKASASGAVGIWHETYLVNAGSFEAIYANMPLFGLAEAIGHAEVDRSTSSSRRRVAHARAR